MIRRRLARARARATICVVRGFALAVVFGLAGFATPAHALSWPDVADRVEKNLASPDASARRAAAAELATLGGPRASALAMRALVDVDVEVRIAAADAALRLDLSAATDVVLPWLGDRESRLRVKACEVARALPSEHGPALLGRALADAEASVRAAAADALGGSGSPEAVPPLLGKLDDASPVVRARVIRALAQLADSRAVIPLVGKVQDSVGDVRREVARALGELGDTRASQALLLQLRDNLPEVRIDAIAALGRLRSSDAVDALAPLSTDRNPALRMAAIAALGRIGTAEAVRALVANLGRAEDASGGLDATPVREALVNAGPTALVAMRELLAGPVAASIATSAAWVLGALRASQESGALISAMRRGALPPAACLRALSQTGSDAALPIVLEFIGDPNPAHRAEAARAAALLLRPESPDGRAFEPIENAQRDPHLSSEERASLVVLLGRTGAARAAATLGGLARSQDSAVRRAAIDALTDLGAAAATQSDVLVELVNDPDSTIRLRGAIALAAAGGSRERDMLTRQLIEPEEHDRAALLIALGGILSREPGDAAVRTLVGTLDAAAGAQRDASLAAIARAKNGSARAALARSAASEDAAERRMVASILSAQAPADVMPLAVALASDSDATVRAEAAWTLGSLGSAAAATKLTALTRDANVDVSANAAAALGRLAARDRSPGAARLTLCPLLGSAATPANARANALVGLALAHARCEGTAKLELRALRHEAEVVRAAAARALRTDPSPDDLRALAQCVTNDRSARVARRCSEGPRASGSASAAVTVYVTGESGTVPQPGAAFLLEMSDGMLHAGTTDRRGAVTDPMAPAGELVLRRSAAP